MLTIKDFKVGDTVYTVRENMGRNTEPTVNECIVKSVGRTYVTLEGNEENSHATTASIC